MKKIIILWLLLKIHKVDLCRPFHKTNKDGRTLCPVVNLAEDVLKSLSAPRIQQLKEIKFLESLK
jgi:hypothetical protein